MRRLLLVTVLLSTMLACSDQAATSSPPPAASTTSEGATPPAAPSGPTAGASPRYTDLSTLGEDRVAAGRYAFLPYGAGDGVPVPVIRVPDGFQAYRGFSVAGVEGPGFRGLMVWAVSVIYRNPCSTGSAEEAGARARDLVDALARQRLTTTTTPRPVRLGEHAGYYVEVTAPTGPVFTRCADSFDLWGNDGGGNRFLQAPGQVDRLWVLDTPGGPIVIDATHTPAVSDAAVRQLTAMARSTRFVASVA